jgi:hypothetical protein
VPLVPEDNPPPLTVAASLVAIQATVLVALAVLELANVSADRMSMGVSTALFFLVYGALLGICGWSLTQQRGWTRGPVLITQLIQLGLAWNLRDAPLVAIALAVTAAVVLAGVLHPATLKVLQD